MPRSPCPSLTPRLTAHSRSASWTAVALLLTLGLPAQAGKPCASKTFKTELVREACAKGGQAEAKKVMKAWQLGALKREPTLTCTRCHTKLAPRYEATKDALEHFKKLGGR